MDPKISKIRSPVRREGASRYLLVTLLSFAASVSLTRFFLELTGYPQIETGALHIAHVLWGGLLLFLSSLLPLVLANRWAYTLGAALSGAGAGLFIDEVGKFLTRANDYFYPPAAPIIYVFFLLTLFLYLQIRRPPSDDPRAVFYRTLEGLQEVLDHDLEPGEQAGLIAQLHSVADRTDNPNLSGLAAALLKFLKHDRLLLMPSRPGLLPRIRKALAEWEDRRLTRGRFRVALAGGMTGLGALQLAGLASVILALGRAEALEKIMAGWILNNFVSSKAALGWFLARLGLEALVGGMLLLAAVLLILRRDKTAVGIGILGLLLLLSTVNLLTFYFEQFAAIFPAAVEFSLLLLLLHYRRRFSVSPPQQSASG